MNLVAVRAVASTTARELSRQRVVLAIFGIAVFLALVSVLLGQLTIEEQERMVADFSLFATEAAALALALTLGSTVLAREIERQTCLVVLARPIGRFEFLLGKWLGLAAVQLAAVFALTLTLAALLGRFPSALAVVSLSLWLKSLVILSWTLAAASLMRPLLAFMFGFALYLLAHGLGDLAFFARQGGSETLVAAVESLRWVIPSFDLYNWKSHFHLVQPPSARDILGMILQTLAFAGIGLGAAGLTFGRRDIV